jgi:ABC-2 type transport system permease protein
LPSGSMRVLLDAYTVCMRLLSDAYTVWLREMIRFARTRSRIVSSLAQPLLFLVIFGSGFSGSFRSPGLSTNYLNFLAPGIVCMTILFTSVSSGMSVIFDKQFGFLKEILVAPVSRTSIVLGKSLGGTTAGVLQGAIILGISALIGVKFTNGLGIATSVFLALLIMFLIGMGFVGFGISIASRIESMEGFQMINNFLLLPIFVLSGAFFPINNLPKWMGVLVHIDPLAYGVDAMRYVVTGTNQFPIMADMGVMTGFFAVTMLVGTISFKRI